MNTEQTTQPEQPEKTDIKTMFDKVESVLTKKIIQRVDEKIKQVELDLFNRYELKDTNEQTKKGDQTPETVEDVLGEFEKYLNE